MSKAVRTLDELKELAHIEQNQDGLEGFIALSGGARSRKQVWYAGDSLWEVMHYIDESITKYDSDKEFVQGESNIMEAMKLGSFIQY